MRPTFRSAETGSFLGGRLVVLAALAALAAAVYGGTELVAVMKNRAPLHISYTAFTQQRPDADWLHIPDGQLDWDSYMYEEKSGKVTRVFVPLRAPEWERPDDGVDEETPVHVLVEFDGKAARDRAQMDSLYSSAGVGSIGHGVEKRAVEGLLRFGVHSSSKERRELEGLSPALTPDFVVLQAGERPNAMKAFLLLAVAVAGGGLVVYLARGGGRNEGVPGRRRRARDRGEGASARRRPVRRRGRR